MSPQKPLAIIELEAMLAEGCQVPGCHHKHPEEIFLNQRCHPVAGLEAGYKKGSGVLRVSCRICHARVTEVAVALV